MSHTVGERDCYSDMARYINAAVFFTYPIHISPHQYNFATHTDFRTLAINMSTYYTYNPNRQLTAAEEQVRAAGYPFVSTTILQRR